ncbi:alpha/beta fold hydrolase [Streptomyces sp. ISL-22]|uniref:alpha/beta hydrolase n=1 Tax=unclassified Streptomyces TaxID=2593676 RepID=UPI001BEA50F1|nr:MULTISPECIES: alpha/beta hydrolase [unclassified Streptomyces]MBT2418767.1 alpha/beta fold hydrolase [Streptomyces sp. ISL-24]MBT2431392.1 alpha/beta fold hydrolase [Streptomyces sp. ISL-22]
MRKRAAVLCGAAVVVAGTVTAVPAEAGAAHTAQSARAASLTWNKCGTKKYPTLQCASLEVPLDHTNPRGRRITLALSRVPHTARKYQGPLLVNPGGPGGSGRTLAGFVASALPAAVAAQYDVIGFDPRGVGRSRPALDCRPGHFDPVRPDSVPSTARIERANLLRAKAFARACGKKYADVLPYIDTVSAAKDLDRIRAALGARQLNYFGYSYGTYLGAVYAKLFPQRVRRAALDSVVDPTGVWYEDNLAQDHAFDDRHRAFMAWVARHDTTYRLGTDPARVEARWYAMRAALARTPAEGKVGAAELEDTFLPGGYYNGYWPHLAEAFAAYVNDRDADPLLEAYERFGAADAADDNGYSVYTSVQCRDAAWPRDWHRWRTDNWAVHAKAPFMTWSNAWYNAPCAFWPTPSTHRPMDIANGKLPPVLLFQATGDAATPYGGAVTVHRQLARSSLVVERGGGNHGITLGGNSCLDKHLAAYLTDGTVPRGRGEADAVCQALPEPKPLNSKAASASTPGAELHRLLGVRR